MIARLKNTSGQGLGKFPLVIMLALVGFGLAFLVYAMFTRGLFEQEEEEATVTQTSYASQLTRDIGDGIIPGANEGAPQAIPVTPALPVVEDIKSVQPVAPTLPSVQTDDWRERLERERAEAALRLENQQKLAAMQRQAAALDSPLAIDLGKLNERQAGNQTPSAQAPSAQGNRNALLDLYRNALTQRGEPTADPNNQQGKQAFIDQGSETTGVLPHSPQPPAGTHELKQGSVIPATLITGVNSDLPGEIIAQVARNVYDSRSGYYLLIPAGAKLFGRYDSNITYGQEGALVVWNRLIFPDGSTLNLDAMVGADHAGYGGFRDQVDRHYLRTFGSAFLLALIGTGTELAIPENTGTTSGFFDTARGNFAREFGQTSRQVISKNLNVQPTITIRPGYLFNVLVGRDIIFPAAYGG